MPPKKNKNTSIIDIDGLSADGRLIVTALSSQLDFMTEKIHSLTKILHEKDDKIDELEREVLQLKKNMTNLKEKIDDADAYERRDTLIFSGDCVPPVKVEESCNHLVCDLLNSELSLNVIRRLIKPRNLYINERLTPLRSTIMFVLRKTKLQFPEKISGCSSIDGKVYVWTKPPDSKARDQRTPINTYSNLMLFCESFLNYPLTNFISEWPH